jgi:hypothetical protein
MLWRNVDNALEDHAQPMDLVFVIAHYHHFENTKNGETPWWTQESFLCRVIEIDGKLFLKITGAFDEYVAFNKKDAEILHSINDGWCVRIITEHHLENTHVFFKWCNTRDITIGYRVRELE